MPPKTPEKPNVRPTKRSVRSRIDSKSTTASSTAKVSKKGAPQSKTSGNGSGPKPSTKAGNNKPKVEDNYVPIHTGMDTVAEEDRSVTDSSVVQSVDGDGVVRIKVRSKQLMAAFRPIRLFLHLFGRFPFAYNLRLDGTVYFAYKQVYESWNALIFTIGSVVSVAMFLFLFIGMFGAFKGIGLAKEERDVCKSSWEERRMRQAMVPLIVFICWSASFAIGSIYMVRYGKRYEFYYNYWNRAVQVMNMDATYGLQRSAIIGHVAFFLVVGAYSALYFSFKVEIMQHTAEMITNAFTRFFLPNIYKGDRRAMSIMEYLGRKNGTLTGGKTVFDEQPLFIVLKTVGFFIMIYSMYGARCFIIQFTFFCRVLQNASFIWNERFRNHLMKETPNADDQTKTRLDMGLLISDHLILVQLFKMTESLFCVVLQWFFAFQVITLTVSLYGFSLITGVMRCQQYWDLVRPLNCFETPGREAKWEKDPGYVSFDSPEHDYSFQKAGDSLTYSLIFFQCFSSLFQTTHAGAAAHEEAMRGWQILRRNSFMTAASAMDRNFVHSLIISFARNNPMQISAGGYFVVNKGLLINIILASMVYFITLLQFRPGQVDMGIHCNGVVVDISDIADDI